MKSHKRTVKQTQLRKALESLTAVGKRLQCHEGHSCHILTSTFEDQDTNRRVQHRYP